MIEVKEIIGRLFIWKNSIYQTQDSLEIAFKADVKKEELMQKNEPIGQFPHLFDYNKIWQIGIEHAIVTFSTIYNQGYKDDGQTATNNKAFRREHLDKILSNTFTDSKELENSKFKCSYIREAYIRP